MFKQTAFLDITAKQLKKVSIFGGIILNGEVKSSVF